MQPQVKNMIEKLDHMSPDRLTEINDFIDFIRLKDRESRLHKEFTKASEPSFAKVWDNDDDTVYDSL